MNKRKTPCSIRRQGEEEEGKRTTPSHPKTNEHSLSAPKSRPHARAYIIHRPRSPPCWWLFDFCCFLFASSSTSLLEHLLLALELALGNRESHLDESLLLLEVRRLLASSDRSGRSTASVHDVLAVVVLGVVEKSLKTGLSVGPGASVEGLLLGPDNGLGVRVHVEVLAELLPREGVELLDTSEGDVVDLVVLAVLEESGIDLTSAENDTLNLLRGLDLTSLVSRVLKDPAEVSIVSELLDVGASDGVAEERLGEEDDEG